MKPITIEIWSDVVCPWCYIGKRRFESALARFEHRDQVALVWRSFELDPGAPRHAQGSLTDMLATKKGISLAQATAMQAQVTDLAAKEGLHYRLDQAQSGNTFDAHRLMHLAAAHGLQGDVNERLLRAYFSEGQRISDVDVLVAIGAAAGLAANDVRSMLDGNGYADEVRADQQRGAMFGISGVPFFVIDQRYGISGAQPPELFLGALEQVWAERHVGSGEAVGQPG